MTNTKKTAEITGRLIYPLSVGMPAYVAVTDGVLKTSTVLEIEEESPTVVYFETKNTLYTLHIIGDDTTEIIN